MDEGNINYLYVCHETNVKDTIDIQLYNGKYPASIYKLAVIIIGNTVQDN
jgi:hypothetical protein